MSAIGFESRGGAELAALVDDLISSSAIEGVVLNMDSVRSSVARKLGISDGGLTHVDHYTDGLVEVMLDAVNNSGQPLTAQRLFDWHAALFPFGRSGMRSITVAAWRMGDEPMQVVSGAMGHEKVHYEAPPSSSVPAEMDLFFSWASDNSTDPVVAAAVASLWFVTLQHFDDGNGRMSRTIADYVRPRAAGGGGRFYSMSAEILRDRKQYYDVLERAQKGSMDVTEWILWFLGCLERALVRAGSVVERSVRKAAYWDRFIDVEVNERQRKVINRLWDGFEGKLTSSKYAKICHISPDTAVRDINDLLDKGMLIRGQSSGRSTHYLLPDEF